MKIIEPNKEDFKFDGEFDFRQPRNRNYFGWFLALAGVTTGLFFLLLLFNKPKSVTTTPLSPTASQIPPTQNPSGSAPEPEPEEKIVAAAIVNLSPDEKPLVNTSTDKNKHQTDLTSKDKNSEESDNVVQPLRTPVEEVVVNYIQYLGSGKLKAAHSLLNEQRFGNYKRFSSRSNFGGITSTLLNKTAVISQNLRRAKVVAHYYAEDPNNDGTLKKVNNLKVQCETPGIYYEQVFYLHNKAGKWVIDKTTLKNCSCKGNNIHTN